jgi:hypothetical protein
VLEAVVGLERVLQREHVNVDDGRRPSGLRNHVGVVADLVFLRGDQQHFHAALILTGAGLEDFVIEVDVLDVERDVLLGLPVDRLREFSLGHRRQGDLLDDHRIARQRCRDVFGLEPLVAEQAADRIRHGAAIDDGAVDDAVGGDRLDAHRRDAISLARGFQFDRLDRARTDVETNQAFSSAEQHVTLSPDPNHWQTEYQRSRRLLIQQNRP